VNGRPFRSKHGVLVPTDDAPASEGVQVGREVSMRVIGDERFEVRQVASRREAGSASAPVATPSTLAATTPAAADARRHVRESDRERDTEVWSAAYGQEPELLVGPRDYRQRRPELESWLQGWGAPRTVEVYAIHAQNQPRVAASTNGRNAIYMNMAASSWRCPVKRLAVLKHELQHIWRGDLGPVDAEGEAECDAAATESIVGLVAVAEQKVPSSYGERIDARTCQTCFAESRTSCRQPESAFARIVEAFGRLLGLSEE
jgi:hypothetical protein